MNIALWIVQILLAVAFLAAGIMKVTQPREKLEASLPWTKDYNLGTVRFIGAAEALGALGLVLPAWTGVATVLTPLAATGLAVVMVLAAVHHGRHREFQGIATNVVLLVLAVFVAWGRFGAYAF